jgi:Flp pilus assembly protein TadD
MVVISAFASGRTVSTGARCDRFGRRTLARSVAAVALAAGLAGCATSERMDEVAVGQSVAQLEAEPWRKLVELGHASREKGDLTTAVQFYRQAHASAPDETIPLIRLGQVLAEKGDQRKAAGAYRAALDLQPGNTRALLGLGQALIRLDEPLAALQQFEIVLNQDPDDVAALSGAGVAADLAGDGPRAQGYLRRGLQQEPDNVTLLNNLAYSLILSADYEEAIDLLEMAVGLPGAGARHRQNLALAYGLAGREAEAARMIRMDFGDDAVAQNLAYYRTRRSAAPLAPAESQAPKPLRNPLAQAPDATLVDDANAAPIASVEAEAAPAGETLILGGFLAD